MSLLKTLATAVLGEKGAEALNDRRNARRISRSPDRVVLMNTLLPAFAGIGGQVLWVGCRRYTKDYPARLGADGAQVWTTDIDPAAEPWGAPGRHRTGDLRRLDTLFHDIAFDAILCNGVFGYGVDAAEDQIMAFAAMAKVLKPGARILLGWNTDKIADPLTSGVMPLWFRPEGLEGTPARILCPPATHVYDLLRYEPDGGAS